jgi:hypothetical protein
VVEAEAEVVVGAEVTWEEEVVVVEAVVDEDGAVGEEDEEVAEEGADLMPARQKRVVVLPHLLVPKSHLIRDN